MQFFMEFTNPIQFTQATIEKASALGLNLGFIAPGFKNDWSERCAIAGNTFAIKDTLKARGARWDGVVKVWTFNTYAALENAIAAIEEN